MLNIYFPFYFHFYNYFCRLNPSLSFTACHLPSKHNWNLRNIISSASPISFHLFATTSEPYPQNAVLFLADWKFILLPIPYTSLFHNPTFGNKTLTCFFKLQHNINGKEANFNTQIKCDTWFCPSNFYRRLMDKTEGKKKGNWSFSGDQYKMIADM